MQQNDRKMKNIFKNFRFIPCDKYGVPFIIVAGLITSVWTNCIAVIALRHKRFHESYYDEEELIDHGALTSFILTLATSVCFLWSYKTKDKFYMPPWFLFKIIETILLMAVSIKASGQYVVMSMYGVVLSVLNVYIIYSVWLEYRKKPEDESVQENTNQNLEIYLEKPPSYDQFTNQIHNQETTPDLTVAKE